MANMDERIFSKAESDLFASRYEIYQAAQKSLEEIVDFLRKQHGIEGEGWQVGQNGFFRMKDFGALPQGDEPSNENTKRQTPKEEAIVPDGNVGEKAKGKA